MFRCSISKQNKETNSVVWLDARNCQCQFFLTSTSQVWRNHLQQILLFLISRLHFYEQNIGLAELRTDKNVSTFSQELFFPNTNIGFTEHEIFEFCRSKCTHLEIKILNLCKI